MDKNGMAEEEHLDIYTVLLCDAVKFTSNGEAELHGFSRGWLVEEKVILIRFAKR